LADDRNGVGVDILRQQVFEIFLGLSQRQVFKDMPQVALRFQVVCFGRFDQTKKGGTGLGTIGAAGKQPVFAPHHKRADGIFE
jgi:hypothetical protein